MADDPASILQATATPAVQLVHGPGRSRIGGAPNLGDALPWPTRDGAPLDFLAQLDLAAIRAAGGPDWLPAGGLLHFFYDTADQPWGYDPAHRGGWAVLHDPLGGDAPERAAPAEPEEPFGPIPLTPRAIDSWPGWHSIEPAMQAQLGDEDDYEAWRGGQLGELPHHQVGGWPEVLQRDGMEWQAACASSGIYVGDASGYQTAEAQALKATTGDWRLLLQLDSEEESDVGIVWGDDGRLFFWIREADARAGAWDRAWLVLQCF